MNRIKIFLVLFVFLGYLTSVDARYVPENIGGANGGTTTTTPTPSTTPTAGYRATCAEATAQTDLNINNVRARLLNGGDMWWDFNDGRYIVPNVGPGETAVSSIFAGAVWIGGFDDGGNLKLAAQTYRTSGNDYWPGPLQPNSGETTDESCERWDRHFTVFGANIFANINNFQAGTLECDNVPVDLKRWPGRGNPHFADFFGFELPDQPLAPFYDENGDGTYNPCDGDFPIIEVRGCEPGEANQASIADQMTFWIYNDNGNIHTQTTGDAIRMEVQVLAFGYATNDEVNDMTFYRHKLINRANSSIDSMHFSMWIDADLGCFTDDLIGCDTTRALAVVYNEGTVDGAGGCAQGTPSYGDEVPILGVDYFRGPLDENGAELGMSSFTYYNNATTTPNPATADPTNAVEYFNYMTGSWRDGLPFTVGGNGYGGTIPTKYVFPDPPNDPNGWSMCTGGVTGSDIRTLQTSGPFRLDPGAVNELIIGVTWVPDILYPCPDLAQLLTADNLAQFLFDNCFKITDGPDAPDMDIVELENELVLILSNDTIASNNAFQGYEEPTIVDDITTQTDTLYRFEGYRIYQVADPSVSVSELDDPEKARQIFQVDINNGVGKVFNWEAFDDQGGFDPTASAVFVPELMVDGSDAGIQHSFKVTEDQFAQGTDRRLINHKKYYFVAIAYAYNNFATYDPGANVGQRRPYLEGRRNLGSDGLGTPYVGIPRIVAPEFSGIRLNANYGDGPQITRLDGVGNGGNFLDLADGMADAILASNQEDVIVYAPGAGPIDVKIVDPIRVEAGTYTLNIFDENMSNDELDNDVNWMLQDASGNQWFSEISIDRTNEQVILDRGISVSVGQVADAGTNPTNIESNGFIGGSIEYPGGEAWYTGLGPTQNPGFLAAIFNPGVFDYVQTGLLQPDENTDPEQVYSNVLEGSWVPYTLCNWRITDPNTGNAYAPYITPAWISSLGQSLQISNKLETLNNVDIVITSDPSKWSRCVVVETATFFHQQDGFLPQQDPTSPLPPSQFDPRESPSLGKDGLPDGDGTGMSWFPGYAINVETGQRVNIFFGENSIYDGLQFPGADNGADMVWNPSNTVFEDIGGDGLATSLSEFVMGGQHFVYVTDELYDECATLRSRLNGSPAFKIQGLRQVKWASLPILPPDFSFTTMAEGLVPADATIKLRVDDPYATVPENFANSVNNNGYPQYQFSLDAYGAEKAVAEVAESSLDLINVVPNPYYAYSAYETRRTDNIVKITNVPARATITIYSLDGKFIRQYDRDESPIKTSGQLEEQIVTSVEWDLKNSKGIPVAAGVYLIHVNVPGVGERVIKWFGVNRTFDAQDL